MEKSVRPIAGELTGRPFHVTAVWDGAVPRKATVDKVARPADLTNTEELKASTSAIEREMLSRRAAESIAEYWRPMRLSGRMAVTVTVSSRRSIVSFCATTADGKRKREMKKRSRGIEANRRAGSEELKYPLL